MCTCHFHWSGNFFVAKDKLKLLFFGTSGFAVKALEALRALDTFSLLGVVCPPDKAQGRGRKVQPNVMKGYCSSQNIPAFQPSKLSELKPYLEEQRPHVGFPDVGFVVAYGKILPPWMLDASQFFPQGLYNVHASLLPRFRGASPMHGALISEDRVTGLSIQKMVSELDAGPVWLSATTDIRIEDTLGTLEKKMHALLPGIIREFCHRFPPTVAELIPQPATGISYAPKLSAQDWTFDIKTAHPAWPQLRAFIPQPGAWLKWANKVVFKVCDVRYIGKDHPRHTPLILDSDGTLTLSCQQGHQVQITELQMPDRPRVLIAAWLNGYKTFIQELIDNKVLEKV